MLWAAGEGDVYSLGVAIRNEPLPSAWNKHSPIRIVANHGVVITRPTEEARASERRVLHLVHAM